VIDRQTDEQMDSTDKPLYIIYSLYNRAGRQRRYFGRCCLLSCQQPTPILVALARLLF